MYTSNVERNRIIYDLWEKNLTVNQISSTTGIPRSTVGYYVRKFNRLAVEGKPVVFPGARQARGDRVISPLTTMIATDFKWKIRKMFQEGNVEEVYHCLMSLKLMKEFGIMTNLEDYKKAMASVI